MKKYIILLLYSCVTSLCNGAVLFAMTIKWFPIKEMLRSLSLDIILFGLIILLPPQLAFILILLVFIPLLLLTFVSIMHIVIYKAAISSFSIMSSLETSFNEATEFFSEFGTIENTAIALLLISLLFFLLFKAIKANKAIIRNKKIRIIALLIICICSWITYSKGDKLRNDNTSYVIINTLIHHKKDISAINDIKDSRKKLSYDGITLLNDSSSQSDIEDKKSKKTYIVIVGESSNRNHMSLYGYHRNTNPELKALAQEITIFTDAVSAATHTIPSLRKTLFFPQKKDDESNILATSHSIIGLLGKAGFETWWLSNQTANSDGLTGTAIIAEDANHTAFFNKARHEGYSVSYDQVLLKALDKVLLDKAPQKAIFLHLIGSHISYHLRYPKEFTFFTSTEDFSKFPHCSKKNLHYINEYDNSIRYTDHIVSEIIKKAKALNQDALVVYFSDHGQEVYDTQDIRGQNPKNPTRHMFDIPFIVWLSDTYQKKYPDVVKLVKERTHDPFSLLYFSDSIAELCRVSFEGRTPENNFFSPSFAPRKRSIPLGNDYDKLPAIHRE